LFDVIKWFNFVNKKNMDYITIKNRITTFEMVLLSDSIEVSVEGRGTETTYLDLEQAEQVLEFLTNAIDQLKFNDSITPS
jgi:hypothetical protein